MNKKKLAVRPRLKITSQNILPQSFKQSQKGFLIPKLQQQNIKLSNSIKILNDINFDNLNISKCFQAACVDYKKKMRSKNQLTHTIIRKMIKCFQQFAILTQNTMVGGQQNYKNIDENIIGNLTQTENLQLQQSKQNVENNRQLYGGVKIKQEISNMFDFGQSHIGKQAGVQSINPKQNIQINENNVQVESCDSVPISQCNKQQSMSKELSQQISQMEIYILQLKKNINFKDNRILQLQKEREYFVSYCQQLQQTLKQMQNRCKILEQQINGYDQKLQILERGNIDTQQCKQSLKVGQTIQQQYHNRQQQKQLQQIYIKTQQTLRRCQVLQQQANIYKQKTDIHHKMVSQLLHYLDIKQQQRESQLFLESQPIINRIQSIIHQVRQQQSNRQGQLQNMIGVQLDNLINVLDKQYASAQDRRQIRQTQMLESNHNRDIQKDTILDKIYYIRDIIKIIANHNNQNRSFLLAQNSYSNRLIEYEHTISQIYQNAQLIGKEVQSNNQKLQDIIKQSSLTNIEQNIQLLERLLQQSQSFLDQLSTQLLQYKQSNKLQEETKLNKINAYLADLEQTIVKLYKNKIQQGTNHQTCIKEKQQMNKKINNVFKQLQHIIQDINRNINHHKQPHQIAFNQTFQRQIRSINSLIKNNRNILDTYTQHSSTHGNQDKQIDQNVVNQQTKRIKEKYFRDNPSLLDSILTKLLKLKNLPSNEEFFDIVDSIFQSIKNKQEKVNIEMDRRKQVLKQRSAAIAQICKRGITEINPVQNQNSINKV